MGCHTWFYAKVKEQPTYEKIKQEVIDFYKKEINWYHLFLTDNLQEEDKWLFENDNKADIEQRKALYERKLRIVEKNLCKVAVCNQYDNIFADDEFGRSYELVISEDKQSFTLYVDLAGKNETPKEEWYHDLFRIVGYPEDRLYSYNETMKFLYKKGWDIQYGDNYCVNPEAEWDKRIWKEKDRQLAQLQCYDRLKEFWDKHPDGMIRFG